MHTCPALACSIVQEHCLLGAVHYEHWLPPNKILYGSLPDLSLLLALLVLCTTKCASHQ